MKLLSRLLPLVVALAALAGCKAEVGVTSRPSDAFTTPAPDGARLFLLEHLDVRNFGARCDGTMDAAEEAALRSAMTFVGTTGINVAWCPPRDEP